MKNQKVSKLIVIPSFIIFLVSFVPLIFPRLFVESILGFQRNVEFFETGVWTIPLIVVNLLFLLCLGLYKFNKLPISKLSSFFSEFDVPKKISYLILAAMVLIFVLFSVDELSREEFELADYRLLKPYVVNLPDENFGAGTLRYIHLYASFLIFDNLRVVPFFMSIGLLLMVYLLSSEISNKRFSGLVSTAIILQSNLFLLFDTTSVYNNAWILFYFISLYLMFKKPVLSHLSFLWSLILKPLTGLYFPINIYLILQGNFSKHQKKILLISYTAVAILAAFLLFSGIFSISNEAGFDERRFITGFSEFSNSFRFDGLVLLLFFPTMIILSLKNGPIRKKIEFIFFALAIMFVSQSALNSLVEITVQPYRYIPLIVFFSISVGLIFSNLKNHVQESTTRN